jgi:hypothetical protein
VLDKSIKVEETLRVCRRRHQRAGHSSHCSFEEEVDAGIKKRVQKQIRVILEDLTTAHGAWKQKQLGNEGAPPLRKLLKETRHQIHVTHLVPFRMTAVEGVLRQTQASEMFRAGDQ